MRKNIVLKNYWNNRVKKEINRNQEYIKRKIHTDLIWREIKRNIKGRKKLKILDVGGGYGRFAIPLIEEGHRVILTDISNKILEAASKIAQEKGEKNLTTYECNADDLSHFKENEFDLVFCLDSPISYCYKTYKKAISEVVRVSKDIIIITVMNRLGVITEGGINFDLMHFGKLKTVLDVFKKGNLVVNKKLRKFQPNLMPSWHAFLPDELKVLFENEGCEVKKLSAIGTLSRFMKDDLVPKIYQNKEEYEKYLEFEETLSGMSDLLGVGCIAGGGLMLTAKKIKR